MTGYTSGKTHRDPKPYVDATGFRWTPPTYGRAAHPTLTYLPRPEFDNHNPILVWLRNGMDEDPAESPVSRYEAWLADVENLDALESTDPLKTADPAHVEHARRVLSKLVASA